MQVSNIFKQVGGWVGRQVSSQLIGKQVSELVGITSKYVGGLIGRYYIYVGGGVGSR